MKLQQAYISEAVAIGNWQIIGYKGPGEEKNHGIASGGAKSETTNFTYEDAASVFTDNTVALATGITAGWGASNKANLNDCTAGKNWTIDVAKATGSEGDATFTATVSTASDCTSLTPNFNKIGK
ncbi:hypothetical protein [Fibrobacter sp.]|uniref:hypothetical protein n=1 Tax=Fibrobacter sp. TaxID=35828 RepID=UPI002633FF37|nr:hypothetical protein [Fibrobacter sp.]MDD5944003.1 hypothetical protein [Fibrobacter sp.]